MKRTYTFAELCEILQDHQIADTGEVSPKIVRIDMIQRPTTTDNHQVCLVAYFDEDP